MQLLWAGRWCLRRVTFPSRARRGSRFEERVARRRGIGKAEVERALNAQGGAERPRLPAGRVQRDGRDRRSDETLGGHRVRLYRGLPSAAQGKHFRTVFREMSDLRVMVRIGRCCPHSFTSFFTVVPASARGVNLRAATSEELGGTAFAHPMRRANDVGRHDGRLVCPMNVREGEEPGDES